MGLGVEETAGAGELVPVPVGEAVGGTPVFAGEAEAAAVDEAEGTAVSSGDEVWGYCVSSVALSVNDASVAVGKGVKTVKGVGVAPGASVAPVSCGVVSEGRRLAAASLSFSF